MMRRQLWLGLGWKLALCWACAAAAGGMLIYAQNETGWASSLTLPLLAGLATTLVTAVAIRHYELPPDFRTMAQRIEDAHPELKGLLLTAVQQDIALLIDLKGTVAGETKYGFAIIEEKGTRKQRLVKAGDVIAGAKVVRINRNAVDLLVDDQERTLKIAETKEAPILPPPPAGAAAPSVSPGSLVLNRSEIGAGLQDMGSMLRQAQVRPYFNAGVPDGFMISSIQAGSLYQKMGIVDGDIIQGVNNRAIRTADDMMDLYNVIKSGSGMALSIKRRGNPETLNYQFR